MESISCAQRPWPPAQHCWLLVCAMRAVCGAIRPWPQVLLAHPALASLHLQVGPGQQRDATTRSVKGAVSSSAWPCLASHPPPCKPRPENAATGPIETSERLCLSLQINTRAGAHLLRDGRLGDGQEGEGGAHDAQQAGACRVSTNARPTLVSERAAQPAEAHPHSLPASRIESIQSCRGSTPRPRLALLAPESLPVLSTP